MMQLDKMTRGYLGYRQVMCMHMMTIHMAYEIEKKIVDNVNCY